MIEQPEVSNPTPECPEPQLWHCYDGMATEVEVLRMLTALVAVTKPKVIVETGTYLGYGTAHLAEGCHQNGFGHIWTAELDGTTYQAALTRFNTFGDWGSYITAMHMPGADMISGLACQIDFAFLDSDLSTRLPELTVLFPKLSPHALVVVHDTGIQHDAGGCGVRSQMRDFARATGMQILNLATPRGVVIMRRQP